MRSRLFGPQADRQRRLAVREVLLDTSAYVSLPGGDEAVLEAIAEASEVFMSIFVPGELSAGFLGGRKERKNRERLAAFLGKPSVIVIDAARDTAEIFGRIKDRLRRAGRPIPINDLWIAAHAIEHGGPDHHIRPSLHLHTGPPALGGTTRRSREGVIPLAGLSFRKGFSRGFRTGAVVQWRGDGRERPGGDRPVGHGHPEARSGRRGKGGQRYFLGEDVSVPFSRAAATSSGL